MGYLVCQRCGRYYKLKKDESSFDFSRKCDCGGPVKYQETIHLEGVEGKNNYKLYIGIAVGAVSAFILFFFFKLLIAPLIGGIVTSYSSDKCRLGARNGFISGILFMIIIITITITFGMIYGNPDLWLINPQASLYSKTAEITLLIIIGLIAGAISAFGALIGILIKKLLQNLFSKKEDPYRKLQRLFWEFIDNYGEDGFEEILSNLDNPEKLTYRIDLVSEHTSPVCRAPDWHAKMKDFFKKDYTDFIRYIYGVRLRTLALKILPEEVSGRGMLIIIIENIPKGWPFTRITYNEFESVYLLLERLYFIQSGHKLGADALMDIYFGGLDERLIFFLDEFDDVEGEDIPEPSKEYFKTLKHVRYENRDIEHIAQDLLYLVSFAIRYYSSTNLSGWNADVLKTLMYCSAVSDGRKLVTRNDVIRAFNTYSKLLNTNVTKYKARQNIIDTANFDSPRSKLMYYTLRFTHGRNP